AAAAAAVDTGGTAKATTAVAATTAARVGILIAVMPPLDSELPLGHPQRHKKGDGERKRARENATRKMTKRVFLVPGRRRKPNLKVLHYDFCRRSAPVDGQRERFSCRR
ncbi:unnamed protein product, partial [Ectocarpus sp. 8 AP-2014]